MKRTRLLALALVICLCAALTVPASAAGTTTFTDVGGHWALSYIQDMTAAGVLTGYGDGTFRPEDKVQRIEGFALCARVTQTSDTRLQIAADQATRLKEAFPDMPDSWWFHKEAATCDTLGVETLENLSEMYYRGTLVRPVQQEGLTEEELSRSDMTKAEFAMYLVRGMGLEDLVRTMEEDIILPFDDEATIAEEYRPYVKVLNTYGVLTGDEFNNFNPDQPMSRAICATMLSRAMEHIVKEKGVNVELPQYTKYTWTSGTIVDVEPLENGMRELKLRSEITGDETIYLSPNTKVYQYNKLDGFTALKTGSFAKVCYAPDNKTVEAVRVTPTTLVEKVSGTCDSLTTDSIRIDGSFYTLDRFTQVSAGGKTGTCAIIDYDANYTDAEAAVNAQGTVLWLKLSGGTRLTDGILTDVKTETVGLNERTFITVKGYNGVSTTYTLPAGTLVTINGDKAELRESQVGRQIILRVSDADLSDVKAVEVNMVDRYVQGVLRTVNVKDTPRKVEIRVDGDAKSTLYELTDDCEVTYRGAAANLSALSPNSFVTAKVEGGTVTVLMAWQGYEDTEGTLDKIEYNDPTTFTVIRENGTAAHFSIPMERMASVSFTNAGKEGKITDLRTGDHVVVTMLYNDVTQVDYTHQAANVTGTLYSVTRTLDGAQLTVSFSDGTQHTYTTNNATTVMQGGKPVNLSSLNPGAQLSLVAEGDKAISIEITGAATRTDELQGVIYSKDDKARIATLLVSENGQTRLVDVSIPSTAKIITVEGNELTNISRLNKNDTITAYGSYNASGVFEATSVVRK